MKISLQRNVIIEESFFLFFPQTQVSGSSKAPLFWCWVTWEERLTRNWSRSTSLKVQVRVRPELAFPLKATSCQFPSLGRGYTPCRAQGNMEMRFHVQTSLRILRHWSHSVKPRAKSHLVSVVQVSSHEAVSAPTLPPSSKHTWDISEVEHWLERGKRDVSPVCPIYNLFTLSPLLGGGWVKRFHGGCILSVSPCREPEVCSFPHASM